MIKKTLFFVIIIALAMGAGWLAEHPGALEISWLGYQINTSAAFLLVALILATLVIWFVAKLLIGLLHLPKDLDNSRKLMRQERGMEALTDAFVALSERDHDKAKLSISKAERLLPSPTLPRLIQLQLLKQSGQEDRLTTQFKLLQDSARTKPLALKGLIEEARRFGKMDEALTHAETLISLKPNDKFALLAALDLYSYHQRWQEALQMANRAQKRQALSRSEINERIATIHMQQAQAALDNSDRNAALPMLRSALQKAPGLQPAALKLAEIHLQMGKKSQAIKVIRKAWQSDPHPSLALLHEETYANLSTDKQFKKAQELIKNHPEAMESQITIARAALKAEEWDVARNHLKIALNKQETITACKLMAQLEEAEHHDENQAKQWLERAASAAADPTWQCDSCGHTSQNWHAHCSECHQFSTTHWKPVRPVKLAT